MHVRLYSVHLEDTDITGPADFVFLVCVFFYSRQFALTVEPFSL